MVKLTADQRRDLMEVIDDRHDRGSTIVATQIPQDSWHLPIGDPTYADAILDRLVNNAYRLELERRDPLVEQMHHFLRVVRREEAPLVSGRDGARTLAATLAVGRSATTGEAVQPEEAAEWAA